MSGSQKFLGERIYLQHLSEANATEEYSAWLNDPEVNFFLETRQASLQDLRDYIQTKNNDPQAELLGVFDRKTDTHIGNVKLEPIDRVQKTAVFGIVIGNKQYWGHGIGTETVKLTLDYAFTILGLDEVQLGVIAENQRAQRTFEKSGFEFVRVEPQTLDHDGKLFDKIVMSAKKEKLK